MKKLIISGILFVLTVSLIPLFAQDIIIFRTGDELKAKVLQVGVEDISYKKYDNIEGPTYSVKKWDLFKIRFENGTEEVFTQFSKPQEKKEGAAYAYPSKQKKELTKFKEKGYFNTTTFGFGMDPGKIRISITTINGYQINKTFASGLGFGMGQASDRGMFIPIFADLHIYPAQKRFMPVLFADAGGLFVNWRTNIYANSLETGFHPYLAFGGGFKYFLNEKTAFVLDGTFYLRGTHKGELGELRGPGWLISTGFAF